MRNDSGSIDKESFFVEEGLEHVDLSYLSDGVAKAARALVSFKYRIDMSGRSNPNVIPRDLHGCATSGEWGPHFGHDFFTSIIPFLPRWDRLSSQKLLVPTLHTFGCSWSWWPDSRSDDEVHGIIAHIFSHHGLVETSYTFIPQLGLFLAGEGKNRVNFCRHHDIEHIPAHVYTYNYPESNRISIYELSTAGGLDVWAVLDDRYVQKVGHYDYALPLLKAYGVSVQREWPVLWPSISELLANEKSCLNTSSFSRTVIDMEAVKDIQERNEASREEGEVYVKASLLNLPVRGMWRFILVSVCISILSFTAASFVGEGIVGNIAHFITAFTTGAIFVVIPRFFWIKRKLFT